MHGGRAHFRMDMSVCVSRSRVRVFLGHELPPKERMREM